MSYVVIIFFRYEFSFVSYFANITNILINEFSPPLLTNAD